MKKFYGILCLLVLSVVSCSKYDDSELWDYVKDMNQRLTTLEEKCKEMNTNISSLQTLVGAFESGDYITNVAPVTKDSKTIGYTISFRNSPAITIYNGTDGYAPVIGVKKDVDDLYYWTIDGEWLLDNEGNKVQASGADGTNGENGITPQLKIENEYWYISYDSGATWQKLGKATGPKGNDGNTLFSSVEVGENEVTFVLADGTSFSIPLKNSTVEDVHEWVDLGLPSGTLWATCNVGANNPGEYGDYFAWGEIRPKEDYSWNTYWWGGSENPYTVTKYCFNYGYQDYTDNLTVLEPYHDAATANWGEDWQMPSKEQQQELINSNFTKSDWGTEKGYMGIRITSLNNGKSIFLPIADFYEGTSLFNSKYGMYWSRSLSLNNSLGACVLEFSNIFINNTTGSYVNTETQSRARGLSVRPVRKHLDE